MSYTAKEVEVHHRAATQAVRGHGVRAAAHAMPISKKPFTMSRKEQAIKSLILRLYVPDLEKLKSWTPPKAVKIGG